ncbi:HAMP domain-containing sensor histidine kinase [Anaeromyxobacter paludicola]|uniref:histidine kinase n=1 Tax=Anaeromyxobacter paludicola TaxID=2918171 RepID=A0ABM7XAK9_9BACT|nr:ATP-binding protein [Anaeromyxobacter paludicola]BDG08870.1 hypothetical protein AMPC_19830 [Anaeromyxobacter paludicola]
MTLRSKLLLAQAPLVVVLLALGLTTLRTTALLGQSSQGILKDNYRSVLAAEEMAAASTELDRTALSTALGGAGEPTERRAEAARRCEAALLVQEGNVTEPGEAEATRALRRHWTELRDAEAALRAAPAPERPGLYLARLQPAATAFGRDVAEVLAINQEGMLRKSERARREADRNNQLVLGATVGALLLGIFATATLTARLLRPLSLLTHSVRRIGEGDLQVRARVEGNDEIAQLAREFNTMADRLGQYRSSSLGELLQAQQAAQAAIDSLPDPVLVLGTDGALVNLNEAASTVLRLAPAAPAGSPLAGLPPPLRAVVDAVRAHVAGGKGPYVPRGYEEAVRVESPEGDRLLLPRATPLYSEEGAVAGATLVLQDVTRLMRFDELKNDLVATVAHEFRTPITSLRMAIHLCVEEVVGPLTEKQADLLHAAREDCERLQTIVDDLLDLSRIQAGRVELHRRPVGAAALLDEAARAMRQAAQAAGLGLTVEAPEPPLTLSADPERVQLILGNLVSNAIRYTPPGGTIALSVAPEDGLARLQVKDTGAGIPREHQERIFEKFFRVPGDRSGGVGLGLYIAREIVQAHGGEMGVESEPGQGSAFWFTLPLAREG